MNEDVRFDFKPAPGVLKECPMVWRNELLPIVAISRPIRTQRFIAAIRTPEVELQWVFPCGKYHDLVIAPQRNDVLLLAESDDAGNNGFRIWSTINVITEENQRIILCNPGSFQYGLECVVVPVNVSNGQGSHEDLILRPFYLQCFHP